MRLRMILDIGGCIMVSKYSVLMSVYRKEKPEYLKQAIESIQAQTLPTDDFVLVCGGLCYRDKPVRP